MTKIPISCTTCIISSKMTPLCLRVEKSTFNYLGICYWNQDTVVKADGFEAFLLFPEEVIFPSETSTSISS